MRAHDLIVTKDYGTGEAIIQARIVKEDTRHALALSDELRGKEIAVEIKKWSNPRSLSANAYFHVLVGKIAEAQRLGTDEVKRRMVLEYGTLAKDENGQTEGSMLPEYVNVAEYYPYAKWFDVREIGGKKFNCYMFYKQTHKLTGAEMNRLIDGVVTEAKELDIETMPPKELSAMLGRWGVDRRTSP